MDIDKLISCVYKRPAIWDKRIKSHSNRKIVEDCWTEVSNEVNIDAQIARKKWKYLRDQFCAELSKIPVIHSGDAASYNLSSRWAFFQSLLFLKDVVRPKTVTTNLNLNENSQTQFVPEPTNTATTTTTTAAVSTALSTTTKYIKLENIQPDDEQHSNCEENILQQEERIDEIPYSQLPQKRKVAQYESFNSAILDIENRKLQYFESEASRKETEDDEDELFFKSLLPHVRKILPFRKMSFRNKIQQLVDEYAYSAPNSCSTTSNQSGFPCLVEVQSPLILPQGSIPSQSFSLNTNHVTLQSAASSSDM